MGKNRKMLPTLVFRKLIYLLPIAFWSPCLVIALPVTAQNTVIYVNPRIGSDRPELGTNVAAPYKTITYALSRVKLNQLVIIQLADGVYSDKTGEKFPIRLRPNVTLRGNETNKGKDVVVTGGGAWRSQLGFPQNVAIAFSDRSELRGVTVTNPQPRGYGLWIENTSPAIANNTFLDNKQDGGLISGTSRAIISANQFFRNGTSGLAIEGKASPDIRGNLFQQTTFGMSIRQDAAPQITENTFTQNQNGILIQGNAKPILRGNAIVNNRDYGLTISDLATPDLGKPNDDGNNNFQGNGTFDLQNVSRNKVVVLGNQLDTKRVKGDLQLSNTRQPANLFASSPSQDAQSTVPTSGQTTPSTNNRFANINQQLRQRVATNQPMSFTPSPNVPPVLVTANPLTQNNIPNFGSNASSQANSPFWYEPVTSVIVRITPRQFNAPIPTNPEISASLPPVRSTPPSGEPINQPIQIAPLANTSLTPQAQPRYRVVVPVSSPNAVAQVRQIVPNSFASRLNGNLVVQIGAYSDRRVAEGQVARLSQKGLSAKIEAIKR
jgi:parallel beta-helix repeat protein